ncbi:MAG: hypothetical protein RLZZ555_390 [Pseudomonadota bacterium]|jgi:SlyX protein
MSDARIEHRLADLEIKSSLADDLLDQLNQLVWRQQQQIDQLQRELAALRDQLRDSATPVFRSLRDELPPHY